MIGGIEINVNLFPRFSHPLQRGVVEIKTNVIVTQIQPAYPEREVVEIKSNATVSEVSPRIV